MAHSDRYGGFEMLTRFDDVVRAARDYQRFRSNSRAFVHGPPVDFVPLSLNPPEQTKYRRRLNRYVSPERMAALEPALHEQVVELLAPLLAKGGGDLAREFAEVLPTRALCMFLHMPRERWDAIQTLQAQMIEAVLCMAADETISLSGTDEDVSTAEAQLFAALDGAIEHLVELRRAEPLDPEIDMISGLLADEEISDDVVAAVAVLMFSAGSDTTYSALTSAVHHLAHDQDDQQRLREDPGLIDSAVEEFLRLYPPLHHLARTVEGEVTIGGELIPDTSLVALNWAAANRDPAAFPDPDICRLDRQPNRHLTFGHGVHKCLGAPLSRLEMRVALQELLDATESFTATEDPIRRNEPFATGYIRLPIQLTTPKR
ncbi:MAG TPA: cytochrome P450 [Solirubrobacteraceae bacterium]|nr:cytochrome P450 [Solirubrobacteraceae bacterium]